MEDVTYHVHKRGMQHVEILMLCMCVISISTMTVIQHFVQVH